MTARCDRPPRGWVCYKLRGHDGPCPTWPAWWNVLAKWRRMKPLGGYAQGGRISPPGPGERVAGIVHPGGPITSQEEADSLGLGVAFRGLNLPTGPKLGDVAYSNAADGTPLRATFDKDGHLGEWEEWLP